MFDLIVPAVDVDVDVDVDVPAVDAPRWVGDEVVPHDSPDHQDEQGWNQEVGDASPEHPAFLERG